MAPVVEPVPGDGPALMVAIVVPDANAAIAFYVAAFGAKESFRLVSPPASWAMRSFCSAARG